jgi:hypothetical protein
MSMISEALKIITGATAPSLSAAEATTTNAGAAVARLEAKIADLDTRANEAAEEGDASGIEALEVALSVERRLLAVAKRTLAEAETRLADVRRQIADAGAAAEAAALDGRRAELDARLEPTAVHAELEVINARIVATSAELLALAAQHDAVLEEHATLHAERQALGGDVAPKIERDVATVNLALHKAGDDPVALARVIGDGRTFVDVTSAVGTSLRDTIERYGLRWTAPALSVFPVPGTAYEQIRAFGRKARTIQEIRAFAISALNDAGEGAHRARIETEEREPARIAAREAHEALQRNGGYDVPDCSVEPGPSAEESKPFDQFLG